MTSTASGAASAQPGAKLKGTPPTEVTTGLGRVHFGSEGGAPNGNMASCLGGGLKVLELQLHST